MYDLPNDLILNILSKLPVESLLRFKSVSKSWYSLINDPKFIKMHLNQSIHTNKINLLMCDESSDANLYPVDHNTSFLQAMEIDFPFNWGKRTVYKKKVHISNSCHGLVCIYTDDREVAIWNPSTLEFKQLPEIPSDSNRERPYYGLGYDSTTDDYKVVKISQDLQIVNAKFIVVSAVLVYTMGSNSWGNVEDTDFQIYGEPIPVLISDDTLHWQATVPKEDRYVIFSVDLKDGNARELPHPEGAGYGTGSLGSLRGNLCLLNDVDGTHADFWEMKCYSVKESWTKIFTIPQLFGTFGTYSNRGLRMLWLTATSEVVFVYDRKLLLLYDPKLEQSKVVDTRGYPDKFVAEPYVGSLVLLKSGTFVGEKKAKCESEKVIMKRRTRGKKHCAGL